MTSASIIGIAAVLVLIAGPLLLGLVQLGYMLNRCFRKI